MNVAINGFGRIGRHVFKICLEKNVNVVAINDLTSPSNLAYLLKYDSIYGVYDKNISYGEDWIRVGNKKVKVLSEKDPEKLPWREMKVDAVVESTGFFTDRDGAMKHINAGAKKVIISAPAKNPDITICPGVNMDKLKKSDKIISVASCTTNALSPVAKILNDEFGIKKGLMTTVHAYTATQALMDGPNKKMRRGRSAVLNIVPTSSGATDAVTEVIPELKGKIDGVAMRVPVACGSIVDFVAELKKDVDVKKLNNTFKKYSNGKMKGILEYTEDEIVSSDVIRNPHSSIVDGTCTQVLGNNFVKVLAWYDNEYGYSNRMVDVIRRLK